MRVPWEKLTAVHLHTNVAAVAALITVRLHKNVARGGGAARGRQSTRAYCGSERIAVRPLDEPRR